MAFDREDPLTIQTEASSGSAKPRAWAIYRGSPRYLITRSLPEYHDRADALDAALKAAAGVSRRLRVAVVMEKAEPRFSIV